MARHDFNSPCDCRECREKHKHITCPKCQFVHVVTIDRLSEMITDRDGITDYHFTVPTGPSKSISCSCGHVIQDVGYYTSYNHRVTQRIKEDKDRRAAARRCEACQKIEGFDRTEKKYDVIVLEEMDGRCICQDCAAALIHSRTPNPSDENNKYEFDFRNRVWKLQKVKKPCVSCGTKRWLNASNQWKDKCMKCYKKENGHTEPFGDAIRKLQKLQSRRQQ